MFAIFPMFSMTVRRLHDVGRSGYHCLLVFMPVVGPIILLVYLFSRSKGRNKYGRPGEEIPVQEL